MMRKLTTRLRSLVTRGRMEKDLDRELAFHLDMLTDQKVRAGMPADAARREALQHFGALEGIKDDVRDTWLSRTFETLVQDVKYGVRSLRRTPGFALAVILTMALGIGANTAIFSVVNAVVLEPLPYANGDRLLVLRQGGPLAGDNEHGFSATEIADYATRTTSLDAVAEFHSMWFILLGRAEPERVSTGVVSANYFPMFGIEPLHGRTFTPADEAHGAPAVLLLSHKYWKRSFGGDPSVVGRMFEMNDKPHQVVGVLPPIPEYPEELDVYMPTSACPFRSDERARTTRDARMVQAIARMRPDATVEQTGADLAVAAASLVRDYPDFYPPNRGYTVTGTPLKDELTESFSTTLLVLVGTAGFVLLIVCASVANLTLARMVRRHKEMSVRAALGANRMRLVRQLLTESTILSIAGALVGLALASWATTLLSAFAARFTTRADEIAIDGNVLLFTALVSVATGLVFGCIPAFANRASAVSALRSAGRATGSTRARSVLIVAQVAVSVMLLVGAGLTARTLLNLQRVDPGFKTDNVLTLRIDLNFTKYTQPLRAGFWMRLDEQLRAIPGVTSVGGAGTFPLNEQGPFSGSFSVEGVQYPDEATRPRASVRVISPGYFETLGQPVLAGRAFTLSDRGLENPVVVINRSMAQHYWPGQDPVGRRIRPGAGEQWVTVVGVVADARQQLNAAPGDELYLPMFQSRLLTSTWLVRSAIDPTSLARQVRQAVYGIDPNQPVDRFRTLEDVRTSSLESPRLTATLVGLFALLALVITAAGIAGVIAFSVNQRTQEFGVRMALGAQRGSVLTMVLGQGLRLVALGLALGLAGAFMVTRVMASLLFGVEPTDATTFGAVSLVLVAVAALACLVPARRAATVDPIVALRVGVLLLALAAPAAAQGPPREDALDGVDTVILLKEGKETFGKEQFKSTRGRFTYLFASAETKAEFDKSPDRYAIQMGGLCARMGKTTNGNPSDYLVHDGKIYIFGSDACHKAFASSPAKFLPRPAPAMPTSPEAARRGRELLDKAAAALGGDLASLTTYSESISSVQQRPTGEVTIVTRTMWRFPTGARLERTVPMANGQTMTFGTLLTSEGAWSLNPQGLSPVTREAIPSMQMDLGRQIVPLLRMRGEAGVAVAALSAERVRIRRGGLDVTMVLDPLSGRVHSTTFIDRGPSGQYGEWTVAYSDFRQVNGFTLPFKETVTFDGEVEAALGRTIDAIAINPAIDPKLFIGSTAGGR